MKEKKHDLLINQVNNWSREWKNIKKIAFHKWFFIFGKVLFKQLHSATHLSLVKYCSNSYTDEMEKKMKKGDYTKAKKEELIYIRTG